MGCLGWIERRIDLSGLADSRSADRRRRMVVMSHKKHILMRRSIFGTGTSWLWFAIEGSKIFRASDDGVCHYASSLLHCTTYQILQIRHLVSLCKLKPRICVQRGMILVSNLSITSRPELILNSSLFTHLSLETRRIEHAARKSFEGSSAQRRRALAPCQGCLAED